MEIMFVKKLLTVYNIYKKINLSIADRISNFIY